MGSTGELKRSMPPIARADARLFILGSLPGEASLAAQQYYAHPQNQFWRLLGQAIGEDLHGQPYDARLERLAERQIGLWDVVGSAMRRGSLDQAIRNAAHNQLDRLHRDFPELRAIAFNGSTAAALGRRMVGDIEQIALIDLPSSSPANTRSFAQKAAAWSALKQFVGPWACPRA